jgi:hypothetical protein
VTNDRALSINSALIAAYMVRERLTPGRVPDVTWFTPKEAEEASILMRDTRIGLRKNADNSTTHTCFVEPTRALSLYAWTLATWAGGGEP